MLFISTGERSDRPMRKFAQDPKSTLGKIVRTRPGGSDAEIWSAGHRNVQAMAFDAQGRLWAVEHGAKGGDELNLIRQGRNYGWPLVAYGEEYSGRPIPGAVTSKPGYEQPVYYWDPVIAPSGAQFYTGKAFPEWRGNLFVGGLKDGELVRLVIDDLKVTGEEHLLQDRNQRIRDVREGPDGALYVVTDERDGELWKIVPGK
jgi:glucose/arabinose dehydrogenase